MIPLVILALSVATRLFHFGYPAQVVFDEVHLGNFITNYLQGTYFFDVHPPFGKLILVLVGHMTGITADVNFTSIGNAMPESFVALRLVPAIAGILLPLIVYYICRNLNISKIASTTASLFIVFENSLTVQSRFLLMDVPMLFCGFLSILCYQESRNEKRGSKTKTLLLTASILLSAAALSVKWTGFSFLGFIILLETRRLFANRGLFSGKTRESFKIFAKKTIKFAAKCLFVSAAFYFLVFAVHFALLSHSGPGDAFMSPSFLSTLDGNQYFVNSNTRNNSIVPEGTVGKFIELNSVMWSANVRLNTAHPYSSRWYSWPLLYRPIFYWQDKMSEQSYAQPLLNSPAASSATADKSRGAQISSGNIDSQTHSYIYLMGNPLIYWFGFASVLALLAYIAQVFLKGKLNKLSEPFKKALFFILTGFLINFLPFIAIGRVMFLYHYEAALVFSAMALAFILDAVVPAKRKKVALIAAITLSAALFVFFAPLTYGTHLSDRELQERMWFSSWR